MHCLITGVAGFIGSHLVTTLLDAGHTVVGVDALTPYYDPAIKRANLRTLHDRTGFRFVEADLTQDDLIPLAADCQWIFHLAGQPGVRLSWGAAFDAYHLHNILGTQRLLEALRQTRPHKLIYASSSSVYGAAGLPHAETAMPEPLSPYGVTKLAAEHMVLAYGRADALPVVALRFFTVYGPRQRPDMAFHRFIQAMSKDAPLPLFGDGSQTRDFTYVDDVVMACLRAAESPSAGIVINIGGGSRVALRETVAYLGEILGKTPRVQVHERQMGDAPHTQAATARATQLLDWQPRTHWREGLLRQVEWQLAAEGQPRATRRFTLGSKHAAPRLLLYGHDTYGLGHLRRNLVIAAGLTQAFPDLSVLLLTGSPVAQQFDMPANVDYVKLPSVVKVADESYQARTLNVDAGEITRMRTAIIREAVNGFAPDVVLVDHAPAGMKGEMLPALRDLRAQRPWTRIALGLRDIVDDPERVRATWHAQGIYDILNELYDAVFVYGMPEVLDVARAYELPANVAARLHYCGYLARERSLADVAARRAQLAPHGERIVLVTAGGGGDGDAIFTTYMTAILQGRLPTKTVSVINTGPFLDTETRNALQRVVADHPQVHLLEFTTDLPSYMEAADLVVCMGGYNTICEVISVGARALVLPRTAPRMEQAIRARRFAELGLVHVLPDVPLTPDLLATEVTRLLTQSLPDEMAINTAILHFAEKGGLGGNVALRDGIKMLLASASPAAMGEARL